jgi:plasmid replication initiation protein
MQNELGVNQHHDAVTGTGKQAVANDYAFRLFKGMKQNNQEYSKLMQEKLSLHKSLDVQGQFSQCIATNSTFLDCPIANYA